MKRHITETAFNQSLEVVWTNGGMFETKKCLHKKCKCKYYESDFGIFLLPKDIEIG